MDRVVNGCPTVYDQFSRTFRTKVHISKLYGDVVAYTLYYLRPFTESIAVDEVAIHCPVLGKCSALLGKGESLNMDLVLEDEAEGRDTPQPFRQTIGFGLVNVPHRRLLVDNLIQKLATLFTGHAFPNLNSVGIVRQSENGDGDLIRAVRSEI